jgi:predicted Zn-dependent peptidase
MQIELPGRRYRVTQFTPPNAPIPFVRQGPIMRHLFCAQAGLVVLLLAGPLAAADLVIPHEQYQLDNGLNVILSQDASNPVVHVQVWYHVGSKDEPEGRSGFAHLFEHLMFNGSAHWDDEYFTPLQPYGARINGTTNTERTNYFETVPSNVLELALWMEADRMGFLLPALTQEKLDNQRDVVRNERRQNYEMRPYGEVRGASAVAMWPEDHPYHRLTIGSHEDLEAATLDDVRNFFRTWYVPNNATLALVGDFDPDRAKAWIERYFGPIERGEQPSPILEASAPLPAPQLIEMTDDVKLPRVFLLWQSMSLNAAGDADLDVLSSLLTRMAPAGYSFFSTNIFFLPDEIPENLLTDYW